MTKSKECVITCKLSEKNRIYLERLGYIDGRTGRKKKDSGNINEFVNHVITDVLEADMKLVERLSSGIASVDELKRAFLTFLINRKQKERELVEDEIILLSKQFPKKKELNEVEKLIEV